jgi:hypothetical protein
MTMPGDMTRTDHLFHDLVRKACRCGDDKQARRLLRSAMALILLRNRLGLDDVCGCGSGGSPERASPAAAIGRHDAFLSDALGAVRARRSAQLPEPSKFRRH